MNVCTTVADASTAPRPEKQFVHVSVYVVKISSSAFVGNFFLLALKVDQIDKVFTAASKQKARDHFTKPQRKNIETWRKQLQVNAGALLVVSCFSIMTFCCNGATIPSVVCWLVSICHNVAKVNSVIMLPRYALSLCFEVRVCCNVAILHCHNVAKVHSVVLLLD